MDGFSVRRFGSALAAVATLVVTASVFTGFLVLAGFFGQDVRSYSVNNSTGQITPITTTLGLSVDAVDVVTVKR